MKVYITLFLLLCISTLTIAQQQLLQSGPMVGHSQMREVTLWVQTKSAAKVHFVYWPKNNLRERHSTAVINTKQETAFTAKCIADEVFPGEKYNYALYINDQEVNLPYDASFEAQTLWQYRTDPPNFTMAIGSCTFVNEPVYDRPGNGYGSDYHIFTTMNKANPDAMLWLGDNTYLREADWFTRTGIHHRYTHTRSLPEMQAFLASTHHYATWDDHDFGPNDSDRSFVHQDLTKEAFELFWANPTYGLDGKGVTTQFQYNDIDFFLLDNRTFRAPNYLKEGEKPMLGQKQIDWLIDAMVKSRSPFKMVALGGQVVSDAAVHENYIHKHSAERDYLLKRIDEEGIQGVIFLTGDRHHSELSKMTTPSGLTIYDVTVSPLTAGAARNVSDINNNRVEGTLVEGKHNFGLLHFSGKRKERVLHITVLDADGVKLWEHTIAAPK